MAVVTNPNLDTKEKMKAYLEEKIKLQGSQGAIEIAPLLDALIELVWSIYGTN